VCRRCTATRVTDCHFVGSSSGRIEGLCGSSSSSNSISYNTRCSNVSHVVVVQLHEWRWRYLHVTAGESRACAVISTAIVRMISMTWAPGRLQRHLTTSHDSGRPAPAALTQTHLRTSTPAPWVLVVVAVVVVVILVVVGVVVIVVVAPFVHLSCFDPNLKMSWNLTAVREERKKFWRWSLVCRLSVVCHIDAPDCVKWCSCSHQGNKYLRVKPWLQVAAKPPVLCCRLANANEELCELAATIFFVFWPNYFCVCLLFISWHSVKKLHSSLWKTVTVCEN